MINLTEATDQIEQVEKSNLLRRLVFRLIRKHVAGSTIDSMLKTVRSLNDEGIHATNVFVDLDERLTVAETLNLDLAERRLEVRGDVSRELGVGVAGKEADLLEQARAAFPDDPPLRRGTDTRV